ncbi:BolA family protein [Conchiformibius kuhniae]|uniref:BolA family protein n=1 Tax=Conchiformibius kuhniae TaxID=211502 RepID=A0A8T9MT81_9NEIS|nr:BolA family protein [Conchiformibius kuhniae]UOP04817.1 BolA family transcriptional regulator [Conchiformibius kuhniae]
MTDTEQQIAAALADLAPEVFQLRDDSHLHIGHAGNRGGGHYALTVVSAQFEGIGRVARQRMVQQRLAAWFANGRIHALSVSAQTPAEFFGL